jgi:hypothetical protein
MLLCDRRVSWEENGEQTLKIILDWVDLLKTIFFFETGNLFQVYVMEVLSHCLSTSKNVCRYLIVLIIPG